MIGRRINSMTTIYLLAFCQAATLDDRGYGAAWI